MILLPHLDIPSGFRLGKIPQEFPFQGPVCSLSWTTSCATWETRSPRRTCRRCSPRSATLRMRTASSPTCPSWTGSLARPKNPTKLQSPLGVTKQHQKQPKLRDLHNHLQTWLHNHHQKQGGAWRIYIKPKHFCLS